MASCSFSGLTMFTAERSFSDQGWEQHYSMVSKTKYLEGLLTACPLIKNLIAPPTQACDLPYHVQVYGTRMDFPLWRRPHIQPESGCFSHSSHGSIVPGSMTRLADQYYNTLGKIIGVLPPAAACKPPSTMKGVAGRVFPSQSQLEFFMTPTLLPRISPS